MSHRVHFSYQKLFLLMIYRSTNYVLTTQTRLDIDVISGLGYDYFQDPTKNLALKGFEIHGVDSKIFYIFDQTSRVKCILFLVIDPKFEELFR